MNDSNIKKPPPSAEGVGGGKKRKERILRPYMKELSRKARRTPTDAEKALWQVLRNKNLGVMFRRQFVIDNVYIVDFVCLEKRLIIECDGGQHSENTKDKERDEYLVGQGFVVKRFWNNEILGNIEGVVSAIKEFLG